jgi:glutathione synthase/RimK-type ligase-like ATP-grasp enzyme
VTDASCWGIARERTHSPGRELDDAEILRLTGKHLEAKGFSVALKTPDEVSSQTEARPAFVFLMCEGVDVLRRLRAWETAGVRQVNSPLAVQNTYRDRMIARFEEANVRFVPSRLVSTAEPDAQVELPVWVKRADVHCTQDGDVVFASTAAEAGQALAALASRSIPRAVLQPHLDGDLIKFYGIGAGGGPRGGPSWFRWFYHADQVVAGHPFDPEALARLVRKAAGALGLEIYGGDAIAGAGGNLVLLDLNAWPSFARFREDAAPAIAGYLALRFRGQD